MPHQGLECSGLDLQLQGSCNIPPLPRLSPLGEGRGPRLGPERQSDASDHMWRPGAFLGTDYFSGGGEVGGGGGKLVKTELNIICKSTLKTKCCTNFRCSNFKFQVELITMMITMIAFFKNGVVLSRATAWFSFPAWRDLGLQGG